MMIVACSRPISQIKTIFRKKKKAKIATTDAPADSWEDEENGDIYEVDHLELFSGLNLEWPPVYDAQFKEKVSCLFSERKAQIVWLDGKNMVLRMVSPA